MKELQEERRKPITESRILNGHWMGEDENLYASDCSEKSEFLELRTFRGCWTGSFKYKATNERRLH